MLSFFKKKTQRQKNASKLQWDLMSGVLEDAHYKTDKKQIGQVIRLLLNDTAEMATKIQLKIPSDDLPANVQNRLTLVSFIQKGLFEIASRTDDIEDLNDFLEEARGMFANLDIFEGRSDDYIITLADYFVANMLALMMNEKGEAELLIYDIH